MAELIEHGLSSTEQKPHGSHKLGKRAVVVGAGIGGLAMAGALARYFEQVDILERDRLAATAGSRSGTPQDRHPHGLLAGGLRALAIGACLGAISVSAYGADLAIGYSRAVAASPHSAPTGRRSIPARPIDPPDREPNRVVQRAALVDQLYDDLMRSSGCVLASSKAAIGGGCFK
jgi:2-polyprenyl-6-methoxyphenol hydroxylase-like FAD-dependent oxidoreductase